MSASPSSSSSVAYPSSTTTNHPTLAENTDTPGPDSIPSATQNDSGKKTGSKRAFRACLHCRFRKAKCDLGHVDNPKEPPCARCKREGQQCVFAPSRRGGRRSSAKDKEKNNRERERLVRQAASLSNGRVHLEPGASGTRYADDDRPAKRARFEDQIQYKKQPPSQYYHQPQHETPSPTSHQLPPHSHQLPVAPEQLAAASLHNPDDAVNLLVLASSTTRTASDQHHSDIDTLSKASPSTVAATSPSETPLTSTGRKPAVDGESMFEVSPAGVNSFPLVNLGIMTEGQLDEAVAFFFGKMHHIFPIVPVWRQPLTPVLVNKFVVEETDLAIVVIVISSRYMKDTTPLHSEAPYDWTMVHKLSWEYLQKRIGDLMVGKPASIGTVEGLLLLSDYLPRVSDAGTPGVDVQEEEKRMSWMLVGTAVRLGYMMGLDQKTFIPLAPPSANGIDMPQEEEQLHRERLAWTYCYMFDRQVSIRMGKAFWSRGPGLCFQSAGDSPSSPYTSFPTLVPFNTSSDASTASVEREDYASLVQAYVELTQTMTAAHDILYPSKDRTSTLVRVGEYYKYLDEFTRSTNGFRISWEHKRWESETISDCVWLYFHYLRLYISSFAFQAHVQRAMPGGVVGEGTTQKKSFDNVIFPRGVTGSPDAKFIMEGINAAIELVKIGTERLHPRGGLTLLPWRFFLFFSYAAVFLLKALFIGAVVPLDQRATVHLLKKLIVALAASSTDDLHPGIRYARLLNALLRTFSRGADFVDSFDLQTSTSTSPTPPHYHQSSGRDAWPVSAIQSPNLSAHEDGQDIPPIPDSSQQPCSSGGESEQVSTAAGPPLSRPSTTSGTLDAPQPTHSHVFDIFNLNHPVGQPPIQASSTNGSYANGGTPLVNGNILNGVGLGGQWSEPDPQEFSMLLNDYEALDSDFWRSLSMQPHDWNFGSGIIGGGGGSDGQGNILGWGGLNREEPLNPVTSTLSPLN
ncbi:hypothetical protein DL96DRAFT_915862 [Flagelloscypha sp. PMI_526]|nr:hypothetical protein DL96DRAFT_915862 [Flagelloscypha sp. PMI_526]